MEAKVVITLDDMIIDILSTKKNPKFRCITDTRIRKYCCLIKG